MDRRDIMANESFAEIKGLVEQLGQDTRVRLDKLDDENRKRFHDLRNDLETLTLQMGALLGTGPIDGFVATTKRELHDHKEELARHSGRLQNVELSVAKGYVIVVLLGGVTQTIILALEHFVFGK